MEEKEKIKVFLKVKKGKTKCICLHGKRCLSKDCQRDIVERDRFRGWESIAARNKYGC